MMQHEEDLEIEESMCIRVCALLCGQSQHEADSVSTEENEIPVQTTAPSGRHGLWRYCCPHTTKREDEEEGEVP